MATRDISDVQVLKAYQEFKKYTGPWIESQCLFPYGVLMQWTGLSFKECYAAMERAERRGLIEYGVSLRSGWITEKGIKLLEQAEEHDLVPCDCGSVPKFIQLKAFSGDDEVDVYGIECPNCSRYESGFPPELAQTKENVAKFWRKMRGFDD